MTLKPYYSSILRLHRWVALALAPFFLLILLSGAVLAFKPITQNTQPSASLKVAQLETTLRSLDPKGSASQLALSDDGKTLSLKSRVASVNGNFDLQTAAPRATPFDLFDMALRLHKGLLVGAGFIVQIASYAMVAIIVLGLLLGWPRLRHTLGGWHAGLAWLALPLTLLTPVTALLMILHLGSPTPPPANRGPAVTLSDALVIAGRSQSLDHLSSARVMRGGNVLLQFTTPSGPISEWVSASGLSKGNGSSQNWVRMVHEGTWAGAWSGLLNLLSALVLTALTLTGVIAWWRRRRQAKVRSSPDAAPQHTTLIAYASQTGTAARLAKATADALRHAGEAVALASLSALRPEELATFRTTLLLVSTTGHGELPDSARPFMHKLAHSRLNGAAFSMLALGDANYSTYCAGGLALREALLTHGAQERLPLQKMNGRDISPWQQWLGLLGCSTHVDTALPLDPSLRLRLQARERLDLPDGGDVGETWQLRFTSEGSTPAFRPGDLLRVSPGANERERCYSIGSSSNVGNATIDLTVGVLRTLDAEGALVTGRASGYLSRLIVGECIDARLSRHAGFNPPDDATRPLILIATGSGIAPFPGFLDERRSIAKAGPIWLFFGNRRRHGDFLYASVLERALEDGTLARLDTAFSRDADDGHYITQRLREHGEALIQWMEGDKAMIYVCGRASTLGAGVRLALLDSLAEHPVAGELPEQTLERWQAEDRLRQDLFD